MLGVKQGFLLPRYLQVGSGELKAGEWRVRRRRCVGGLVGWGGRGRGLLLGGFVGGEGDFL